MLGCFQMVPIFFIGFLRHNIELIVENKEKNID